MLRCCALLCVLLTSSWAPPLRVSERIKDQVVAKLGAADAALGSLGARGGFGGMAASGVSGDGESALTKAAGAATGLAVEGCEGQMTQIAKKTLFGSVPTA
jgi:hypothetical protein